MMKKLAVIAALSIIPASAFAQNSGAVIRDPAGGATRDPALRDPSAGMGATSGSGVGTVDQGVRVTRDPAGGATIESAASPRFQRYVVEQRVPSYRFQDSVAVGTVLPSDGVVFREVPREYGATEYRYTVVNDRTVLVDPRTRRIVQVIE